MADRERRYMYMNDFINSAPLDCRWPRETVLIANGNIYLNETGSHVEEVFLEQLRENMTDPSSTIRMYLSYSPCNECSTLIINFLEEYRELKFDIKFAHVYYKEKRHSEEIREGLKLLEAHKRITLKAVRGEDWETIMRLILGDQVPEEWAQSDVEEWSTTKESILRQQVDWEQDLDNALMERRKMYEQMRELVQTCKRDVLEEIMTKDHENWGTELGRYLKGKNKRELHNIAMQVLYNHGEGSLTTIVNAANGQGYAFLLHVLRASGIAEKDLLPLLRKRIIADFVADKEFRYIIDEEVDGEANAAVGNEAAAAAQ